MKTFPSYLALLPALALNMPLLCPALHAQEMPHAVAAEADENSITPDILSVSDDERGSQIINVTFPEPMIAPDKVGTPLAAGAVQLSKDIPFTATWISTSSAKIVLETEGHLAPMDILNVRIGCGLQSLVGSKVNPTTHYIPGHRWIYLHYSYENRPGEGILISAEESKYDALLAEQLKQAYFKVENHGVESRMAAKVRPATVGDALDNWRRYEFATGYNVSEEDQKAFETRDRAEVLPYIWYVEPAEDVLNATATLMIPQFDEMRGADLGEPHFTDKETAFISNEDFAYMLSNKRLDKGLYEVRLEFTQPIPADGIEELMNNLPWETLGMKEGAEYTPMQRQEDGSSTAACGDSSMTLRPALSDMQAEKVTVRTEEGETEGYKALLFRVETSGERMVLRLNQPFTSVYGDEITENDLESYRWEMRNYTVPAPARPRLYSDVLNNNMAMGADCKMEFRYRSLQELKVNVHRVDADSPQAAVLLGQYLKQYSPAAQAGCTMWMDSGDDDEEEKENSVLPPELWTLLPHQETTITLPAGAGEETVDLKAAFADTPARGMFFVDARGITDPEWQKNVRVVNQGLIQVTDLGLMWKTCGKDLFVYGYRLSDGKPLPQGKLRLLDSEGKTLAEAEVKDGITQTKRPDGLTYLQVVSGDDCYTTTIAPRDCDISESNGDYDWNRAEDLLSDPAFPVFKVHLFTDRKLYRPGETVHLKGIARYAKGTSFSIPELESVTVKCASAEQEEMTAAVADDGSFSLDIPLKKESSDYCFIGVECHVKGDTEESSPDFAMLRVADLDQEKKDSCRYIMERARSADTDISISDFRRNAFEVKTALELTDAARTATITTEAVNLTGAPVADGQTEWRLVSSRHNFYPEAYGNYLFGDYRSGWEALDDYYDAYYGGGGSVSGIETASSDGALDEQGHGSCTLSVSSGDWPVPVEVTAVSSVTDGNEQTIKNTVKQTWHPAAVYAGVEYGSELCRAGEKLCPKALLVTKDGKAYSGSPLNVRLTVRRKVVHNYRYGANARTNVHNSTEWVTVVQRDLSLGGQPTALDIPTTEAGQYEITLAGKDADGHDFRTAVTKHVWGSDESPWEVESGTSMDVMPAKVSYNPGDTAELLVKTPVDGELLVTLERDGVLRHLRRSVTVQHPVITIPLTEEDAPEVNVSVFLVQTGDKNRNEGAKPLQKMGSAHLRITPVRNKLAVKLDVPDKATRPGKETAVSGTVCDADGKPMANASVTLFAEDEGTLQVQGYTLKDPIDTFLFGHYRDVLSYSSLNQLLGDNLAKRDFGNKGVFIGGGGEDDDDDEFGGSSLDAARENFAPCALWLADIRTDAEGRFSTVITNPDTLTRYRLMAVAAAGADRFGTGTANYKVDTPVRVEPSAPLTATLGDELLLPATVSMSGDDLPETAEGTPLTWTLTMSGNELASAPQATQTVTLQGTAPKTVLLPVSMVGTGEAKLTWRVQGTDKYAELGDAAAFTFTVRPPMPFLRESLCATLPAKGGKLTDWLKGDFAKGTKADLTFSTSPLCGATEGMRYLIEYPHGCVEQLSSALLPWAFKKEFSEAVGLRYPEKTDAAALVADTVRRIKARRLENGLFSYWDGGNGNRNFTPYVAIVLSLIHADTVQEAAATRKILLEELLETPDANLVGMVYLALSNGLTRENAEAIAAKRKNPDEAEMWMLALALEAAKSPAADTWLQKARKAKGTGKFHYGMPSAAAAEMLYTVLTDAKSEATAQKMRRYVEQVATAPHTTYESGWMCINMALYIRNTQLTDRRATVNGHEISLAEPWHTEAAVGDGTVYRATGAPVYVSGRAEGYQAKKQQEKMVDKGFAVTRRYERLMPDGTWQPTGTFQVGDVVRVTLTARHTDKLPAVYMALEDRLPAAFEAVNPALTTQGLPEGVATDESNWADCGFINNRAYFKDCVRFYVTHWGSGNLTARYIARVVKSGKVTAPAAKAELMYRPQVYGLSVPQHFTVTPR